jgi:hypothetical protein
MRLRVAVGSRPSVEPRVSYYSWQEPIAPQEQRDGQYYSNVLALTYLATPNVPYPHTPGHNGPVSCPCKTAPRPQDRRLYPSGPHALRV